LATGLGLAGFTAYWPLLAVAFVGTINPSDGDVSVFLPTEQSLLADAVAGGDRVALFARYNLAGALGGGLGPLAAGAPELLAHGLGLSHAAALRAGLALYGLAALPIALLYRGLPARAVSAASEPRAPLSRSRAVVLR